MTVILGCPFTGHVSGHKVLLEGDPFELVLIKQVKLLNDLPLQLLELVEAMDHGVFLTVVMNIVLAGDRSEVIEVVAGWRLLLNLLGLVCRRRIWLSTMRRNVNIGGFR